MRKYIKDDSTIYLKQRGRNKYSGLGTNESVLMFIEEITIKFPVLKHEDVADILKELYNIELDKDYIGKLRKNYLDFHRKRISIIAKQRFLNILIIGNYKE